MRGSGTTLADQSGNGNNGTLANATWAGRTAGKFGNALSFNGTNAIGDVPDSTSLAPDDRDDARGLGEADDARERLEHGHLQGAARLLRLGLYANTGTNRPSGNIYTSGSTTTCAGPPQLPLNTWTHLAATYDGTVLALYVNGTRSRRSLASGSIITTTGALKIGGNTIWGEYFNGLIDEVRVYNRALTAAEIQSGHERADQRPRLDAALCARHADGDGRTHLCAAHLGHRDRQRRRRALQRLPLDDRRLHAVGGEPDRTADGHSYTDTVAAGHLLLQGDGRGRGRQHRAGLERGIGHVGDTDAPSAPGTLTADRLRSARRRSAGVPRPTTSASSATTSTAATTRGFTPSRGQPDRPADRDELHRHDRARHLLLQGHRRGRGRQRRARLERGERDGHRGHDAADRADRPRPRPVTGSTVNLSWTASTDNVGVVALQRPPRHDRRLHAGDRQPDRAADGHDATPTAASRPAPTTTR